MAASGRDGLRVLVSAFLLLSTTAVAAADVVTLRMSTIAPVGSGWARELAAFARDVEASTDGSIRVKVYYGGIAGDEFEVLDRIKRDQLDGAIGSEMCVRIAPSMKVTRVVGMFASREESAYVVTRLKPVLDQEFLRAGFINLGEATLGPEVLFTRTPVRDMTDLRRLKLWIWDLDGALATQAPALGMHVQAAPIEKAAKLYDDHAIDGFIAIPTGALAFQWSAQARYLETLRLSYRNGCLLYSSRAFDALGIEQQRIVRAAAAKLRARMEDLSARQDDALLGGLFARQGLSEVPVSEQFRFEFFDAARDTRQRLGAKVVPPQLLDQVLSWLADYRAEHQRPQ
jgi:TRAP-type C4-dicarboxylate transport system substrate-binding protein